MGKCMQPGTEEETVGSGVAVGGLNMAGAGNDPCGTGVGSYCGRKNSYCCPSGLFCDSMRTFKCMQPGTEEETVGSGDGQGSWLQFHPWLEGQVFCGTNGCLFWDGCPPHGSGIDYDSDEGDL